MIIENETLEPCPFCGQDAVMFEDYRYRNDPGDAWLSFGVMCSNSDCIMHQRQKFYQTESAARRAWNRRAYDLVREYEKSERDGIQEPSNS